MDASAIPRLETRRPVTSALDARDVAIFDLDGTLTDPYLGIARSFFETVLALENPGFVSVVAVVATVWVLQRSYGFSAAEIARAIEALLAIDVVIVAEEQAAFEAMLDLASGGSFGDAPIGRLGRRAGCSHTVTFDRRAARVDDFEAL